MKPNLAIAVLATLTVLAPAACRKAEAPPAATAPATTAAAPAAPADSAPAEAATAGPLAGTRWRVVEIQSMDDATGTARPEDPALYTIAFGTDGQVAMRLNCNRGTGPWKADPGASADSGNLAMGPLAVTRALCPPPSLDERIARDSEHVRTYLLRDGRLALSLEADAAIYLWEPQPDESNSDAH